MPGQQISFEFIMNVLNQVEIFKNLPLPVIDELSRKMIVSELDANEKVINQGEKGSSMYIVIKGQVKVHDKEYVIANLPEGSFFGEFSLLDDEPRSLSVSTLVPSTLGNIVQADFYAIINKYPEVTKDIIKVMLKRLRNQNQQIIMQLRQKQIELEQLVKERTSDLRQKNEDLENTLIELKKTQQQLIQQEKLASLGQITAGIAHEIQNPLNFINNFSSLSVELLDEVSSAKDTEEQNEILSDIKLNLSKIEEHGKRADRIVKGMLMHTKASKGEKQLTDIPSLCEQSYQLAFNSLSANLQNMKCSIIKNYSDNIPELKVVPQEISRVLINLINNSFYALNEKSKKVKSDFIPELSMNVSRNQDRICISIWDNGSGISESNKTKIFQPFFTTKPTGQGTGLGLSTGYELVKSHGGEFRYESIENEFTEFIFCLPVI